MLSEYKESRRQSIAKGIIVKKIVLANDAILKLWAAHPYPKFSWDPSMVCLFFFNIRHNI